MIFYIDPPTGAGILATTTVAFLLLFLVARRGYGWRPHVINYAVMTVLFAGLTVAFAAHYWFGWY